MSDEKPGTPEFAARVLAAQNAADRLFSRVSTARDAGSLAIGLTCDELDALTADLWFLTKAAQLGHLHLLENRGA